MFFISNEFPLESNQLETQFLYLEQKLLKRAQSAHSTKCPKMTHTSARTLKPLTQDILCLFLVDNNFLILFFSENAAIIVPDIEFPKHKNYKFIIHTFMLNIIIDVKKNIFSAQQFISIDSE
jgi:hypothetical protein